MTPAAETYVIADQGRRRELSIDYKAAIRRALDGVRDEGRYRVFADLKRHRGDFPLATWTMPSGETRGRAL